MVGERNSVVARYKDGRILKGFTHDFVAERPTFHLQIEQGWEAGATREVKVAELKALFFVKTYEGNKEYQERRQFQDSDSKKLHGMKIKVEFFDGEILRGISLGYNKKKAGFFVIPIDPHANNERVYVVADAAKSVTVGPAAEK